MEKGSSSERKTNDGRTKWTVQRNEKNNNFLKTNKKTNDLKLFEQTRKIDSFFTEQTKFLKYF